MLEVLGPKALVKLELGSAFGRVMALDYFCWITFFHRNPLSRIPRRWRKRILNFFLPLPKKGNSNGFDGDLTEDENNRRATEAPMSTTPKANPNIRAKGIRAKTLSLSKGVSPNGAVGRDGHEFASKESFLNRDAFSNSHLKFSTAVLNHLSRSTLSKVKSR